MIQNPTGKVGDQELQQMFIVKQPQLCNVKI